MMTTLINERCTDVETWDEARFLARLDYELNQGAELTMSCVSAYVDEDSQDFGGPLQVRIEKTQDSDLMNSTDEYLDPYWDLEVVSPFTGSSPWGHGPSYRVLADCRDRLRA